MASKRPSVISSISDLFGRFGAKSVRRGSAVIEADAPPELHELVGAGDTVHKGDVVLVDEGTYPQRLLGIFSSTRSGFGPDVLYRPIDDGPLAIKASSPTSCLTWNDELGWRRTFKRLSQADVDAWFAEAKKALPDGWHTVSLHDSSKARVRAVNGIPVEIERSKDANVKLVTEEIGRITGFELSLRYFYNDAERQRRTVARAVRREPPRV